MDYLFQEGTGEHQRTLLLLHGTGGNEQDMLPIAKLIDERANVLSIRGNVLENGMPRFFRRLEEGVFDEADLIYRTEQLYTFLNEKAQEFEFNRNEIIAVGYSNGANIAASLLFHYADALKGAILHHPMVPRRGISLPNLSGTTVFIAAGTRDPLCPPKESEDLHALLEAAKADVTIHWENNGHQLTKTEVEAAHQWYTTTIY